MCLCCTLYLLFHAFHCSSPSHENVVKGLLVMPQPTLIRGYLRGRCFCLKGEEAEAWRYWLVVEELRFE